MYGSEIMLWKERETSRVRVVQVDNLSEDYWVLGGWTESGMYGYRSYAE